MGTTPWSNDQARDLIVPGGASPTTPHIFIGPDVPAILTTYYNAHYPIASVLTAAILIQPDSINYQYTIAGTTTAVGVNAPFLATGWVVNNTTVHETVFNQMEITPTEIQTLDIHADGGTINNATDDANWFIGRNGGHGSISILGMRAGVTIGSTGDWLIDNISQGRGIRAAVRITTIGTLVGPVSAETDIPNFQITAPVITGRMYRIGCQPGLLSSTVPTDTWNLRVRRDTAVTGNALALWTGSGQGLVSDKFEQYLTFGASANVDLFLSIGRQAGTGTFSVSGSPGGTIQSRGFLMVEDMGDSTQWSNG